ncbi:MAG: helicase HerA domain-containing protein [archaeon]
MSSYIYMLIFIVLILFVIFLKQLLTTEEIKKKEYDAKIEDGINDPENPKIYGVSRFRKAMFLERLDGNGTNYLQMAISVGGDKSENIQENIENIFDGVDTLYIGSITVDSEDYKNREGVPLPYSVYLRVAVPGKSNLEKVYNDIIKELQNSKAYQENSIRLPPLPGYFYFTTETQEISGGDKETVITTPVYTEYIKPELNEKEWGTVNKNKLEPERGEDFPSTGGGIDEVNNLGIEDEGDEVEIGEDGLPTSYGRVNEDSNYDGVFGFKYDNNKAVKAYVKEGATDVPGIGGYMVGTPGRGKSYALCSIIEEFLNKNPKSCPVLFDTPRDNIFSFLYPNNEPNKLEQKRINKFKENPQWDFNPKNYPIKVFLLGTNEKDNPCDEIFQINTQELNNKEFFKLIGSVYDDDLSPAQRRNLRKIKEIADTYKADGYNINDLKEIVIELENNAVKYKDILMKTNSEEDIENNKIMKSSTSSVLVDKLYILHKQLGDILVRNGGNDPF